MICYYYLFLNIQFSYILNNFTIGRPTIYENIIEINIVNIYPIKEKLSFSAHKNSIIIILIITFITHFVILFSLLAKYLQLYEIKFRYLLSILSINILFLVNTLLQIFCHIEQ